MIEIDGVQYCNASEAARLLGVERGTFYANVKRQLERYKVGARRRRLYRVADLNAFRAIEPVAS